MPRSGAATTHNAYPWRCHGTSNGASFYTMTLEKRYIPESIESVYGTITDDLSIYDINGRRVTVHDIKQRSGKSIYICNGRKLIL